MQVGKFEKISSMRLHKMALCGLQARESLIMGGSFCMRKTQNQKDRAFALPTKSCYGVNNTLIPTF